MWRLSQHSRTLLQRFKSLPYFWRTGTGPVAYESDKNLVRFLSSLPKQIEAPSIKHTNEKVDLVPRSDHDWIADPSIIALRNFTAGLIETSEIVYGDTGMRKYGNAPKCVHYIETADLAVNLKARHLNYPNEVIAFASYAHDLGEDFRKLGITARVVVDECWKGDKKWRALLIKTIDALTDDERYIIDKTKKLLPEEEHEIKRQRHLEQIRVANADPTGLVAHIRFCDKLNSLVRDYSTLIEGQMPFGNEEKFRDYFEQRREVVKALNVNPRLKRLYKRLLNKVETALDEFAQDGKVKATRNDLLDFMNFVPRSSSDKPRLTQKALRTLAGQTPSL